MHHDGGGWGGGGGGGHSGGHGGSHSGGHGGGFGGGHHGGHHGGGSRFDGPLVGLDPGSSGRGGRPVTRTVLLLVVPLSVFLVAVVLFLAYL